MTMPIARIEECWWQINKMWVWNTGGMIMTGRMKVLWQNLFQWQSVHHKSRTDWPGIQPVPLHQDTG